jgi:hypothetical protein
VTTVLLTGGADFAALVSSALEVAGCECVTADAGADLAATLGLEPARFDGYVQLPVVLETSAGSDLRRMHELLTNGLVARFETAESAVPMLRDGGVVVLVAGNTPGTDRVADDRSARYSLLRVLCDALLADTAGRGIRAVVLGANTAVEDVVAAVVGNPTGRERAVAELVTSDSDMDYDEWRAALLSLVTDKG